MTAKEAEKALAISAMLWRMTKAGEIACVKIGRAVRYSGRALADWIASLPTS